VLRGERRRTESMSRAAKESGAHLIAISTDYVFDGNKGGAYVEDDVTNPLNVYGASNVPVSCSARVTTPLYALVGDGGTGQERRARHR